MFRNIYASKNTTDADMIISLLKSNGFHPLDLQRSAHAGFAGADIFFNVQIPDEEYKRAKEFLSANGFKNSLS